MSKEVVQLISQLRKKNINLKLNGDKLKINAPPGVLNNEIKNALKENKSAIVEFLKSAQSGSESLIQPITRSGDIPQSFAQEKLWFLHQLQPSASYNMANALTIHGPLQIEILSQAFQSTIKRHEILRTHFATNGDGLAVQTITDNVDFDVPVIDLSALDEAEQNAKAQDLALREAQTGFDLSHAPLLRVKVLKRNEQEYILLLCLHHIIADGWSLGVLVRDVMLAYASLGKSGSVSSQRPLPELTIQYADYAQWQRERLSGERGARSVAYWQKALAGVPDLLDLPTDKARPEQQSFAGAAHFFSFSAKETLALKQFAQEHDLTLFMLLLAAFQVLLGRLAQQEDVSVGVPVAGRDNAQAHPLIGFFINALVLRGDMRGNPTLQEYLQRVRKTTLGAFEHQDVPMEEVLKQLPLRRNAAFNPGAQVGFSWQAGLGQQLPEDALQSVTELSVEPFDVPHTSTIQDLTLSLWEGSEGIEGRLEYASDLFLADTISQWVEYYRYLLNTFTQKPDESISNLELLPEEKLIEVLGFDPYGVEQIKPLSPMQRDIYLDASINPQSLQNSMAYTLPLKGEANTTQWQNALNKLVAAEPMLRTKFVSTGHTQGEGLYQVVQKHRHHNLHILDWRPKKLTAQTLNKQLKELLIQPYDINQGDLFSHYLILVSESDYVLAAATHHINSDGVGMSAHARKWLTYYALIAGEGVSIPHTKQNFQQQVTQIRSKTDRLETLDYWREKFRHVEPLVFSLPSQKTEQNHDERITLKMPVEGAHWREVNAFCRKQRIVPALYFKMLYGYLVKQYCRPSEDFEIAEFNAGRNQSNLYDLGIYYNQQPFVFNKQSLNGENAFVDVLKYGRDEQKNNKKYRHISIGKKLRISPPGPLIFTYNYYHFDQAICFSGEEVSGSVLPPVMDQSVQFVVNENGDNISLNLDYSTRLFRDYNFLERLHFLSEQILSSPDIKLKEFELLLPRERQLLASMNALAQRPPSDKALIKTNNVQTLFEQQVEKTPAAIAIRYQNEVITYSELNQRANQLAYYLREAGVGRNQLVAICLPRCLEMMVALLGVLKAGAAYLPLDPDYPEERLSTILNDSDAAALIVLESSSEKIGAATKNYAGLLIDLEEKSTDLQKQQTVNSQHINECDDLIYVIYTSGSTGLPKGAGLKHRGELNLLNWYVREFEINDQSRVMMLSAFGFDLTQKNLLAPLVSGAELILPEGELIDAVNISRQIEKYQVSLVNCAPSVFYPLLEAIDSGNYQTLSSLRQVIFGGEPIQLARLLPWLEDGQCHVQVVNNYGPTECTDIAAFYRLSEEDIKSNNPIPVGRANDNVALYLVNEDNQLLPQGLIGELCISGEGVGLGYLNREELNKTSFEVNPYCDEITISSDKTEPLFPEGLQRWYRSGDLMRYQPDGNLEFISRKDFQVKVRGLRIEPGEIEWALNQSPLVEASLVLAHEDKLLAFVLKNSDSKQQDWQDWDWRKHLRRYVPDSMLPSLLQPLAQWPLTPNGKIDRKALPKLAGDDARNYVAPRNPVEEALCEIWAQVLGLDQVGIEDNFFEIGGHSLLATRIISRCRSRFQVEVPLRELFESPTIATLAVLVEKSKNKLSAPPIETAPAGTDIPLSFAQQRLWFIDQLNPGNVAYLMPGAFKIRGPLNNERFIQALKKVVKRHQILRTRILSRDGEGWQEVYEASTWQPHLIDLSTEKNQQARIEKLIKTNSNTALDLSEDALFKITLAKLSDNETLLVSCMHHIIGDGWSFGLLLRELAFYYGLENGRTDEQDLPPLPVQYGDYSLWQRNWMQGEVLDAHIDFWQQQLLGAPAVLNLPFDRPRPKVQSFEGSNYAFTIEKSLAEKLKAASQDQQITLFMLLLGAYKIQLSRYSGQKDICVGLPVAGRDHAPTEELIGLFLNAIVLRTQFEGNATLVDYYQQLKSNLLACLSHQDLPAEILLEQLNIERSLSHAPVAQVGFQLQSFDELGELPAFAGLELENLPLGRVSSKYDMTFILRESKDGLGGVVEYSTALFDESSIAQFVQHYITLLESIVSSFEQGIDDVGLVTKAQLAKHVQGGEQACEISPLSHMQRDLVLLSRVTPDTLDNCFGGALIFPNKVDGDLLYKAMEKLAGQSSILRSRIALATAPWLDDAYRLVGKDIQLEWETRSDSRFENAAQSEAYVRAFVFRPYDLTGKLLRFQLLKTDDKDYLLIAAHHALMDGMGVTSMVASLLEVYHSLNTQQETLLPEEYFPQYLKKERQHTDTPEAIRFWRDKLSSTAGLSQWRINKSIDQPLNNEGAQEIVRRSKTLDEAHWQGVKKYCRAQRITPALYFKGLFGLLVKLYCRPEEDFSLFELSADLLGMKLNAAGCTVQRRPFIFELEAMQADQSLVDYFKRVREEQRAINKSGFHTSIMMQKYLVPESRLSFMYNYYHFTREFEVAGHSYDTLLFHNDVEQVHLVVNFKQGQLSLGLHYPQGEFEDFQFVERLEALSQQIIGHSSQAGVERISELDFTLAQEKSFIKQQMVGKKKPLDRLNTVQQQFEMSQKNHPEKVAVCVGETELSYDELQRLSNHLAAQLLEKGISQNSRVAICLPRSPELIIALVAVIKAGATYVPIDISYPQERIAYIVNDSEAALVISSSALLTRLPDLSSPCCFIENLVESNNVELETNITHSFDDIFYIIYTSGSTGQPKGAAVKQQGVSNLLDWYSEEFKFNSAARHLLISAFGFDLTQKNLWAPLLTGACIYFPEEEHYDPQRLLAQIQQHNITTINCAPSAFYGIVEACEGRYQALQSLQWLILGGEAIVLDRLRDWLHSEHCHAKLVNNYGPTECTDIAAFYILDDIDHNTVPIGRPNTNVNLHLVNDAGQKVPPGVVGELCISGAGVGAGYLNKPELSEKVFQTIPEKKSSNELWYRSGDLMCLLPNGDLEFVGRKDFQIKLRGLRIELQEIEAALLAQEGVEDCLVQIDRRPLENNVENAEELERLVAYIIGPDSLNEINWFQHLSETLPVYMIPSSVIVLSHWPLTPNGKVDRSALPKIEELDATPFVPPRNDIEEGLAQIWCEVLGLNRVGIWDNFFQVGGNSLLAVRIVARMEKKFHLQFSLSMLFTAQNIAELAQLVATQVNPENWSPLVLIKEARLAEGESPLEPLYLIHPVGGTILCYHALAEALQKHEAKRPIYGLQCSGLLPEQAVFDRFEVMATYYLEVIQAHQKQGPYYLAGQSLGGNIAWEMAQQLGAQNQTIAFVGLIDTFAPQNIPKHYRQQSSIDLLRSQLGDTLQLDWKTLEKQDLDQQISSFYTAAQEQGIISAELSLDQVQRMAHVMKANGEALLNYQAQACAAPVLHVRATENINGDSSTGWSGLATGGYSSAQIVASHDGILQGVEAEKLAEVINAALVSAEQLNENVSGHK